MLVDAGGDIEKLSELLVSKVGEESELSNAFKDLTETSNELTKAQENLEEAEVSEADKNHPLLKDVKPLRAEDL